MHLPHPAHNTARAPYSPADDCRQLAPQVRTAQNDPSDYNQGYLDGQGEGHRPPTSCQ